MQHAETTIAHQEPQSLDIQKVSDFENVRRLNGSVLLESSLNAYGRGKASFALHSPVASWKIGPEERIPEDWAERLDSFVADRSKFHLLFFSYEFGAEILAGKSTLTDSGGEAKLLALSYDSVARFDSQTTHLPVEASYNRAIILSAPNRERYLADVSKIKHHIHEGDIYQANYTDSWKVRSETDPWTVYTRLRNLNPSQYGAFANLGERTIISSSPERLFTVQGDTIQANPIKGTIAIGENAQATEENMRSLLSSAKDKAELLMIVDLLRNDLGRICRAGEVHTESVWRAEEYSSLIHLVGDIHGKLRPDVTFSDIIASLFPGGSITGAPKKRAVEILSEIEGRPRGIYTGSIGYVYGDTIDFNIAIRTMSHTSSHENHTYTVQAGGGIVADSDPANEFDEARLKARNLIRAIDHELEF